MSKKSDDSTGNILKRLAVYLPSFFALHYVIAIILYASLGIYSNWGWYEFALVPFNHAACLRALPNMNASSGFPLGSGANMTDYPGPYVTHGLSLGELSSAFFKHAPLTLFFSGVLNIVAVVRARILAYILWSPLCPHVVGLRCYRSSPSRRN